MRNQNKYGLSGKGLRQLRILIQHPTAQGQISGVATYVDALASALRAGDIEVRVLSSKTTTLIERLHAVYWADIVHLNSNDIWSALASRALGRTCVLKIHHVIYQTVHYEYSKLPFHRRIMSEVQWLVSRYKTPRKWPVLLEANARLFFRIIVMFLANRLISCSDFIARSCDFPREIVTVLNPVMDNPRARPVADANRLRNGFLFVGRLDYDKGADILIKAAALLKHGGHGPLIRIVGDGDALPDLEHLVKRLGLPNVRFLGRLDREEVDKEMASAIALVCPSRVQEAAGYTPVEAALQGTMSIVAHSGGLPEMGGSQALVFPPEDTEELSRILEWCIANEEEVQRRGHLSYGEASVRFNKSTLGEQFLRAL